MRFDDQLGREGRATERTHLARADKVGKGGERLVDIRVRVGAVHLVEVDVVGAEPSQARLDGPGDPAA